MESTVCDRCAKGAVQVRKRTAGDVPDYRVRVVNHLGEVVFLREGLDRATALSLSERIAADLPEFIDGLERTEPGQAFRCLQCGTLSSSDPNIAHGYCGKCRAWTGREPVR